MKIFLSRLHALLEQIHLQLLKYSPSNGGFLQQGLNFGYSRTLKMTHIMDLVFIHLRIMKIFLNRLHALLEQIHFQLVKYSPSNGGIEVNTFIEGINFNGGLGSL